MLKPDNNSPATGVPVHCSSWSGEQPVRSGLVPTYSNPPRACNRNESSLYRSMDRMVQQGLIREISSRPAKDMDDGRRRYYRITPFGREVAMAESGRLAQMLDLARAKGLAPRKV